MPSLKADRQVLTAPEAAAILRIKPQRLRQFIEAGLLKATDVRSVGAKRPRYRVHRRDLLAFEAMRSGAKPTPPVRQRRRRPLDDGVIEFFR